MNKLTLRDETLLAKAKKRVAARLAAHKARKQVDQRLFAGPRIWGSSD